MRIKVFPPGYIVGTDSLQIHLFIPDVSQARAYAIHGKIQGLVDAVGQKTENIAALQDDVCIYLDALRGNYTILCGHEYLGDCPPIDIMDSFHQLCLVCHKHFPLNFKEFWQTYLYPIVSCATEEQMAEMHHDCPKGLWAAMVAESMGQPQLLSHRGIGQAVVKDWSIFAWTKDISEPPAWQLETHPNPDAEHASSTASFVSGEKGYLISKLK
ncbi:uncharacterized protein EV420DRAFT_1653466 [Desarmillaria tabescens]|uniref:Uncharacterized protein n=1 Tax=Armillaria tabescens TaxID=1929756 RepID=A0AA39MHI7_ARMTA|nr:uncharacterized protein EV420DRAFT_1653466 [Desarmillaria tabescens]KAK0435091.1 hypothetical protein EV420DRAFT_1653466 [Desarmillaria tabescens]